jgi:ABC-type cobalamin/Fe3+-siderophores transport system ATPase subunit
MLAINNLTYRIGDNLIFKNISAEFNDSEIIGITGPAGSGKSTFIDLLRKKHIDYNGDIIIDNADIKTTDKKRLKTLISYYSTADSSVNPESIVKEWVLGGRINYKKKLSPYSEIDREIAIREIENFGLSSFNELRLKLISKTSLQMASLARTFAAQSKIMLLKNPETGLNINQKVLLTKCIKKYTIKGQNTVILSSTDLNFLAGVCDRIIVLADNVIAETGTQRIITGEFIKKYFNVEAIVTKNIYSGLPEIQIIEEN